MRESHTLIARRVGQRLKQLRAGRTQVDFARMLGLTQSQYNRYETGKRLAPDEVIERVARVCGITPEEVIWGEQASGPQHQELVEAVVELVQALDKDSLEDLYFFLKNKVEDLARRRRAQLKRMGEALEKLRLLAG